MRQRSTAGFCSGTFAASLLFSGMIALPFISQASTEPTSPVSARRYHLEVVSAFENPKGHQRSEAIAINENSEVVGTSNAEKSSHAFVLKGQSLNRVDSGDKTVSFSMPRAINASGQVVGSATANKESLGFIASLKDGGIQLLKPLEGDAESSITAINDEGTVVGISRTQDKTTAVYANAATGYVFQALTSPQNSKVCRARAVTTNGGIYGDCESNTRESFAVFWQTNSNVTALAPLPNADSSRVYAASVEDVVGSAVLDGLSTAVMWKADGQVQNLGVLGSDDASEALAVNEKGLIVGYSSDQTTDSFRAVVFADGKVIDLNSVVDSLGDFDHLTFANGVNSKGQIVGVGNLKSGGVRGYVLTPM